MTPHYLTSVFGCSNKFIKSFERNDPFNQDNIIQGYICHKKGPMGGSIVITAVNGQKTHSQLIYGTPKLLYPYADDSRNYVKLEAPSAVITEKWNGMNVLFFIYHDARGKQYMSAKSKRAPFLTNSVFGNYYDLTVEAMKDLVVQARVYSGFGKRNVAAISCELCGWKEPHLVKYNFPLDLKLLFSIDNTGKITPFATADQVIHPEKPNQIADYCKTIQLDDLVFNQKFRESNKLPLKYEHDHFATEGKVLYLLDQDGHVINNNIYKIKPKDIEEVHWSTFDVHLEGRVREACKKILLAHDDITAENLQDELDMGPKEWSRFGKHIIKFLKEHILHDPESNYNGGCVG